MCLVRHSLFEIFFNDKMDLFDKCMTLLNYNTCLSFGNLVLCILYAAQLPAGLFSMPKIRDLIICV